MLLLAVVVSCFASRLLPIKVPSPLLQMAMGAGFYYAGFEVEFQPHLFLLLFIPPLLFLDGWRIPKGALFHDWRPILALAIGLVVFTVVGIGLFVHWLIPAVPLAVAFALAAILSPTDPVAVGAGSAAPSRRGRWLLHAASARHRPMPASSRIFFTAQQLRARSRLRDGTPPSHTADSCCSG
jgi:CPA1 family monovalent cation:H+ antiporter